MRTYFGYTIHPTEPNASGMKYWAFGKNETFLRADTLEGIKNLIRNDRENTK